MYGGRRIPLDEAREECRKSFGECAPRPHFKIGLEGEPLSVKNLVHLSSRLDVPDPVARGAVNRLRRVIVGGDRVAVREILDAAEITEVAFAKCRCEGKLFPSHFEREGLASVARAAFPPERESPEYWADRAVAGLTAVRVQMRRAADLALTADASPASDEANAQLREGRRTLCETVREARQNLAQDGLASMFEITYRKYTAAVGSPDAVRGMLEQDARSNSCPPRPRP